MTDDRCLARIGHPPSIIRTELTRPDSEPSETPSRDDPSRLIRSRRKHEPAASKDDRSRPPRCRPAAGSGVSRRAGGAGRCPPARRDRTGRRPLTPTEPADRRSPAAHPSPLEERDDMPTASTVRRITPPKQRNFGQIYDVFPVPDLTEIQTRSYERFLQADVPAEERDRLRPRRGLPRDLPDQELRHDADAGIHQVRPGQAALRARRVPPAPPDLRPAAPRLAPPEQGRDRDRGVGLPRRHADHDRRRRVHHQRRRARRRQPAPPQPRRRLRRRDRGRRPQAPRLPRHPRARKLDRAPGHQEGHAGRPDRPVGQVLVDDAAPRHEPAVLVRRGDPRRPSTRPRPSPPATPRPPPSSKAGSPAATSSTPTPARS